MKVSRLTISTLIMMGLSCDSPQIPEFATAIKFPLGKKVYNIFDLQKDIADGKDSVRLEIVSDSVLIRLTDNQDVVVGDDLTSDPEIDSASGFISNDLKAKDSTNASFSVGFLAPITVDTLHAKSRVIPAFNVNPVVKSRRFPQFRSVTIVTGTLTSRFTNNTQAGFDSLKVYLIDSTNNASIDSFSLKAFGSGKDTSIVRIVNGKTISGSILVLMSGHSTGSSGVLVPSVDTSLTVLTRLTADVTGSSITGKFPSQTIYKADSIASATSSDVDTAYIEKGTMTLNFRRQGFNINSSVIFSSRDFINAVGDTLRDSFRVTSIATNRSINMSNYRLVPKWTPLSLRYLHYQYRVVTDASTNDLTTIANGQGIKVTAIVDTLHFSRLRGTLNQEEVTISPRTQDVNIKHLDSIQIQTAFFEIITEHKIPFPVTLDLTLEGRRSGTRKSTVISGNLAKYSGGAPRRDTLKTPVGNYGQVAALLSLVPDSIYFSGKALVGNNVDVGVITKNDSIRVKINLRAPLVFKMPNDSTKNRIRPDPDSMKISDDTRQKIYTNLNALSITGSIINNFPVDIDVQFIIDSINGSNDPKKYFDSTNGFKLVFPSAPMKIPARSTKTVNETLYKADFERVFQPDIPRRYSGFKARLLMNGTDYVRVMSTDSIKVDVDMEVEVQVDKHLK